MEDLRNFCSKVDVDAIRAKIPPMPQIKLPKSVSKIKSRKFFRISRHEFSSISRRASSKRTAVDKSENIALPPLGELYPPIPPSSGFIDRTPTRISTISSLMNQNSTSAKNSKMWHSYDDDEENGNSYRNAGGIDDYYPSPMSHRYEQRMSQPISPLKAPHISQKFKTRSQQNVKMSFGEKLHKGYKDLTEFKLKHIFAKRTIVHADKIEVNSYIPSFEEDRKRDEKLQRKIDRNIADNYRFQFKVSQQKSEESVLDYDTDDSTPENIQTLKTLRNLSEQSGDESGMESSPPNRAPGIAATRFSRVRHPPLNMPLEDDTYNENNENIDINKINNVNKSQTKFSMKTNYDKSEYSRNCPRKSIQVVQQEEIMDFDDDDDNIEIEDIESPKIKPKKNTHSRQSPRRKSAKGIAATITTKDRNAPINRTQEEDLDVSDGDIELNEIEDVESSKIKSNNNIHLRQNPRKKSAKGIEATITSKDRNASINKTQEEDLDVSDGDIDLEEPDEIESSKLKQTKKTMEDNSRLKLRKSTAFSKDRKGDLNITQPEEIKDGDIEFNEFDDVESLKMNQIVSSKSSHNNKGRKCSNYDVEMNDELLNIKQSKTDSQKTSDTHRNPQRNIRLVEDSDNDSDDEMYENFDLDVVEEENSPKLKPNTSSLYDIKKHKPIETNRMSKSIKERMSRLTKQKVGNDEISEKKRQAPSSPEQHMDNDGTRKSDKPLDAIKTNLKRIHKSIRISQNTIQQSGTVSENDDAISENRSKLSRTQQFSEHLKRFRSTDTIDRTSEDGDHNKSPKYNIANKIQIWKNSLKKKVDSHNVDNDDDYGPTSPQKQGKPVGSLIKKLKHIRSRRRDSTDDPDDDEEGGETYKESLASRAKLQFEKGAAAASQMPQITMKKISETKKLFKKKQSENDSKKKTNNANTDEEDLDEGNAKMKSSPKNYMKSIPSRPPPPVSRPYFNNYDEEFNDIDNHKFITKSIAESELITVPAARAVWTTKPILSDDTTDYEEDLPRVVLHQDNSNVFEPTLIIAVTRPLPCTSSPMITELPPDSAEESTPDTKSDNLIPQQDMVTTLLEMTPPSQQKYSKHTNSRNQSIDSSSDDSWIKDIPRGPSIAVLRESHENQEPWKYQKRNSVDTLYKTKSIDLFEMQKEHGGVSCAFEDFDEELRNTPVVKVDKEITSIDETETDDNEEFKDFDDETEPDNAPFQSIEMVPEIIPSDEMETEEFKDMDDDIKTLIVADNNNSVKRENELTSVDEQDNRKNYSKKYSKQELNLISNIAETLPMIENELSVIVETEKSGELIHRNVDDYQRDSSEELENPDDDSSSRITKINVYCQDSNDDKDGRENDKVEIDNEYHRKEELDRPPSKTPSPPPIPQRKPSLKQLSIEFDCPSLPPPPLPVTKPPLPPNKPIPVPPKIPDRNSASTVAKPLVKTASLRLAYNEQVNPKDIGKVNKLISRFETEAPYRRPKVIPRKPYIANESDESSENEDLIELLPKKHNEKNMNIPKIQKNISIDSVDTSDKNEEDNTQIHIFKSIDRIYAPRYNIEHQNINPDSVNVSEKNEKKITPIDISNNRNNKFTTIDTPEIPEKTNSKDSADIPAKNSTVIKSKIVSNDTQYPSIDIPEIEKKSKVIKSNEITKIEQTPSSVEVFESNQTKCTPNDFPEIQEVKNSTNSIDVKDKNESQTNISDISKIQKITPSLNSVEVPEKVENKSAPKDIPIKNVKKSTPFEALEIQQNTISKHSTDIPHEKEIYIVPTKQKTNTNDSIDIPDNIDDDKVSQAISKNLKKNFKTTDMANANQNASIDLMESSVNDDIKPLENEFIEIHDEINDKNDKNSKSIDIQVVNNCTSISIPDVIPDMEINSISRDSNDNLKNGDSNLIDTVKVSNTQDKNDRTPIDISCVYNKELTTTEILNKSGKILSPIDISDSNANISISVKETNSSSLHEKTNLDLLEENSVIIESIPNISISSNTVDINSNIGQSNSVYGSPLDSPVESTEVTPIATRKETELLDAKRNRRNVDNENITSFDSDDENSYYSISSTSSNRNVVEL
ncbi:PIP82 [Cochliomyia hominivorax]